ITLNMLSTVPVNGKHLSKCRCLHCGPERKVGEFVISSTKMVNKCLAAMQHIVVQHIQQALAFMLRDAWKCYRIKLRKRPELMGEFVSQSRSKSDFNTLDGVHHDQTKLPIKGVSPPHGFERCARLEAVVRSFERIPIRAQSVVAD